MNQHTFASKTDGLSLTDCLLMVAVNLPETFTTADLVLAAWKRWPQSFGLPGMEAEYPCSNRVLAPLCGRRGLVSKGLLQRTEPRTYRLTPDGIHAATMAQERRNKTKVTPEPSGVNGTVQRAPRRCPGLLEAYLLHLLELRAFGLHGEGRKAELTFTDACQFWGLGPDTKVDERLAALREVLTRTAKLGEVVLSNGRCVTEEDVEGLRKVSDYLEARFARHLGLMRNGKAVTA